MVFLMWILFHINKNYLSKILYYPKEYLTANQNTFIRKNNKNTKIIAVKGAVIKIGNPRLIVIVLAKRQL